MQPTTNMEHTENAEPSVMFDVANFTDDRIIYEILEAVGLVTEFGKEKAIADYGSQVDLVVAREWMIKSNEAEEKLAQYKVVRNQLYYLRKRLNPMEDRYLDSLSTPRHLLKYKERLHLLDNHPEISVLRREKAELQAECDHRSKAYDRASNEAFAISKKLFKPQPKKPRQPKPEKDYAALVEYWERKLSGATYRLNRAIGALETAQKNYDRICGNGSEILQHFHMGMVGGSGKNVKALNRKKERQLDSTIEAARKLRAAQERVNSLQSTVDLYQKNLDKAASKVKVTSTQVTLPSFADWVE
jgi:hypothetical protein